MELEFELDKIHIKDLAKYIPGDEFLMLVWTWAGLMQILEYKCAVTPPFRIGWMIIVQRIILRSAEYEI